MTGQPERSGLGALTRALLWVVGGMVLFLGAIVLTAPELLGADTDLLRDTLGIVGIAAVPGVLLLVVAAARRIRHHGREAPDPDQPMAGRNGDRPDRTDHPDQEA